MAAERVCIIGAGISGMTLFQKLLPTNLQLICLEENPYPGGQAAFYGCKAVDKCLSCGVCILRDALSQFKPQPEKKILLSAYPKSVYRNEKGKYEIGIRIKPNKLDWQTCINCGKCVDVCDKKAIKKVTGWKYYITEECDDCGKCLQVCPVDAINLQVKEENQTIKADAVLVASGFKPFDPAINHKWGNINNSTVITGSTMEQLFYQEKYLPMDNIKQMAFVQCVGSRNLMEGQANCSRVCCAYALRMAARLKQEFPEINIDYYYMDTQNFQKQFDQFISMVQPQLNMIRNIPINIGTNKAGQPVLIFENTESTVVEKKDYDLVVLSNGICPGESTNKLADMFNLDITPSGFLRSLREDSSGIFVTGTCTGPQRIQECQEQAISVSQRVLEYLRSINNK